MSDIFLTLGDCSKRTSLDMILPRRSRALLVRFRWRHTPDVLSHKMASGAFWAIGIGLLQMEIIIWLGVCVVVAILVRVAAPYHQRLIDNRHQVAGHPTWD